MVPDTAEISNLRYWRYGAFLPAFCPMVQAGAGIFGGRGGIRTHGALAGTPVFKTGALNHSATLPIH
jgi:hypothetical protein